MTPAYSMYPAPCRSVGHTPKSIELHLFRLVDLLPRYHKAEKKEPVS